MIKETHGQHLQLWLNIPSKRDMTLETFLKDTTILFKTQVRYRCRYHMHARHLTVSGETTWRANLDVKLPLREGHMLVGKNDPTGLAYIDNQGERLVG